jgi:hypothetical protein
LLSGGNVSACNEVAAEGSEEGCASYLSLAQYEGFCRGS